MTQDSKASRYYTQQAESADGKTIIRYRGKQARLDFALAAEFTKAVRELFSHEQGDEPQLAVFRSGDSCPPYDVELKWNAGYRRWELK